MSKLAYSARMLSDEEVWLEILRARNILSHVYDSGKAKNTIVDIREKYLTAFKDLRKNLEENWIIGGE
ncbi:MAG: nucleotidyltransferase substrate binding protein [Selenomonadaceae bacterium]|nr:nucleotidyltransferase substrate binding protein [Selenomonadaceae bacterium]